LSRVDDNDVRAIAAYLISRLPASEAPNQPDTVVAYARQQEAATPGTSDNSAAFASGAAIFAGACATCHNATGMTQYVKPMPLALSSALTAPDPRNLIHIIVEGIWPPEGSAGPLMPGFAGALTDRQIADLAAYLRTRYTQRPAWRDLDGAV